MTTKYLSMRARLYGPTHPKRGTLLEQQFQGIPSAFEYAENALIKGEILSLAQDGRFYAALERNKEGRMCVRFHT